MTHGQIIELAETRATLNPELSFTHNRDLLLVLIRGLPEPQRLIAQHRLVRMQQAFDASQIAAKAASPVPDRPRRRPWAGLPFGWRP